jgi:hypothetical protein
VPISENEVSDFFTSRYDIIFKDQMTVGRAKYLAIEFYEIFIGEELPDDIEEDIHNYYNYFK